MKRYVYMIVLVMLSALFAALFSFAGVDRFFFYVFFVSISAFLCGLRPMPLLAVFCACDWFCFKSDEIHLLMLFVFAVSACLAYRKLRVYQSLLAGFVVSLGTGAVLALCLKFDISVIFDKLVCYLAGMAVAMPLVFALRRAGLVNRKKVRF